jgi:hypothetical protein
MSENQKHNRAKDIKTKMRKYISILLSRGPVESVHETNCIQLLGF